MRSRALNIAIVATSVLLLAGLFALQLGNRADPPGSLVVMLLLLVIVGLAIAWSDTGRNRTRLTLAVALLAGTGLGVLLTLVGIVDLAFTTADVAFGGLGVAGNPAWSGPLYLAMGCLAGGVFGPTALVLLSRRPA